MKPKIKIEFLKDRKPFIKGDVIECSEDNGKGLLNTGEKGSCRVVDAEAKVTPRETLLRRADDRKAKEAAKLKKLAEAKAKEE